MIDRKTDRKENTKYQSKKLNKGANTPVSDYNKYNKYQYLTLQDGLSDVSGVFLLGGGWWSARWSARATSRHRGTPPQQLVLSTLVHINNTISLFRLSHCFAI